MKRAENSHGMVPLGGVAPDLIGNWWQAEWEFPSPGDQKPEPPESAWQHPIAGIHVRRTDHGSEAPFRMINEYMERINKWWNTFLSDHPDRTPPPHCHRIFSSIHGDGWWQMWESRCVSTWPRTTTE
jgi:hypothetical protein